MNTYLELKNKQQKEVNEFPMFFAFNQKQFEEGMKRFGLEAGEMDKIYKLGNTGGFYLKTDSQKLFDMMERHEAEMEEAIRSDETGEGFILEMFRYELDNHEYGYTWDLEPTLDALGLTMDKIKSNNALLHGLKKALRKYRGADGWSEENEE
jgi:hypothetical protein